MKENGKLSAAFSALRVALFGAMIGSLVGLALALFLPPSNLGGSLRAIPPAVPPGFPTYVLFTSDSWPTAVAPLVRQVPRVVVMKPTGESGTCSGVIIAKEYVLTAAHCIALGVDDVSITVNGRHTELERSNLILDLAVLKVKVRKGQVMELAPENPPVGTEIAAAGYLLGAKDLHVQFGRISAYNGHTVVVNVQVLPGDSGGPLLDTQGRLVGMTQRYYEGSSVTIGAHVEAIRDFVEPFLSTP